MEFRSRYNSYHQTFGFWEFMNGVCVFFSMCVTHWLLNYKFFPYGLQVFEYIEKSKTVKSPLHDPMCELFPTEVDQAIRKSGNQAIRDLVIWKSGDLDNHANKQSGNLSYKVSEKQSTY